MRDMPPVIGSKAAPPSKSASTSVIAPLVEPSTQPQFADRSPGDGLVLVVTGSTIAAETRDRPLAYRLREKMLRLIAGQASGSGDTASARPLQPVVCSDLWYLNARELAGRPAIAIGEPNTNAATAMISNRLPTVFVIEGKLRVHADVEFIDLRAALWGVSAAATEAAIEHFAQRHLGEFLRAAATEA